MSTCDKWVGWWDDGYGPEYEGELPEGHDGDHYDGMSWYDDDGVNKTDEHAVRRFP